MVAMVGVGCAARPGGRAFFSGGARKVRCASGGQRVLRRVDSSSLRAQQSVLSQVYVGETAESKLRTLQDSLAPRGTLLIDGHFVSAVGRGERESEDPRTGHAYGWTTAEGTADDADQAVASCRAAFDAGVWPRLAAAERGRVLWRIGDLLDAKREALAQVETLDVGKPLAQSLDDVQSAADVFRYYAGLADKVHGRTAWPAAQDLASVVALEPVGVVAAVVPFNFPLLMAAVKVAPALAAGCTVVLKPSETTPLSALVLGDLALDAGLPPGVLNVVPGAGEGVGHALARHDDVDAVAFTGSTQVGRMMLAASAEGNLKRVHLELGGKSPLVIGPGADVEVAARVAATTAWRNGGQVCCASGSRTFVHESMHAAFVEKVAELAEAHVVGDPFAPGVDQGPQASREGLDKALGYVRLGREEGARVVSGGDDRVLECEGHFMRPVILDNVTDAMAVASYEIFGPVLGVLQWTDMDELVARCNRTRYGLAAAVVSKDLDFLTAVVPRLRAGTVWINGAEGRGGPDVPFGGYKQSGWGRDKGHEAMLNYLEQKSIVWPMN